MSTPTPRISALVNAHTRTGDVVRVKSGRTTLATLHPDDLASLAIRVDDKWTPALAALATDHERARAAVRQAIRWLARSERSREVLMQRLVSKGFSSTQASRALDLLKAAGLQSDERVRQKVLRAAAARRDARARATETLRQHGVEDHPNAPTENAAIDAASALALARDLLARLPASLTPQARARRALATLSRRGYEQDVAMDALRAALPPRERFTLDEN